jgi:hypothetical protein
MYSKTSDHSDQTTQTTEQTGRRREREWIAAGFQQIGHGCKRARRVTSKSGKRSQRREYSTTFARPYFLKSNIVLG